MKIFTQILILICTVSFFIQITYGFESRFSNGDSLRHFIKHGQVLDENGNRQRTNRYTTLEYDINLEILKEPLIVQYIPNKINLKIIDFIKKLGYQSENYNYLGLDKGEDIEYPFLIKQIHTIQNEENYDMTLKSSFFPLTPFIDYPLLKEGEDFSLYVAEDYGIYNPQIKINQEFIKSTKKYKLYKRVTDGLRGEQKGTAIRIQNEWNWDIQIPAGETINIEFSYYATDINQRFDWIRSENHYGYYYVGLIRPYYEGLYTPLKHSLTLPEGYSVQFPHTIDYKINSSGFYDNIPLTRGQHIEIIKDSDNK